MPEPTPEAWAQIRHAYENTDKPLAHICAEHEVSIPTVRYRMKRWEWRRRKPLIPRHGPPPVPVMEQEMTATVPHDSPVHPTPPPPGESEEPVAMVPRLQAAAARVLPAIEVAIARLASGTLNANELEKAGRTLATLTRTLRELNALLVQNNAGLEADESDRYAGYDNIEDFRAALARRIHGLVAAERSAEAGRQAGLEAQNGVPNAAMDGPGRT
jgi:hypothetical protein